MSQIVRNNAQLIESTDAATGTTICERDGSGNAKFKNAIGEDALNDAGTAGGLYLKYATKTADYTVAEADGLVTINTTSANRTITLPAAATSQYKMVWIKRLDAGEFTVTIDGSGSETIDGQTTIYLNAQYEAVLLWCDGSNWHEVTRKTPESFAAKSASFSAYGAKNFLITNGAGVIVVTLPPAAVMKGQTLTFKKVDAGAGSVTLTTNSTETIDGTNDPTLIFNGAGTQYDVLTIASDGSNWHYLADRGPAT
jgi:hypothetical protein